MIEERLIEIISDILEVNKDEVIDDFSPDKCETWDSLNNLRIVTAIEEEFKITLAMQEIETMTDFKKIRKVIAFHSDIRN